MKISIIEEAEKYIEGWITCKPERLIEFATYLDSCFTLTPKDQPVIRCGKCDVESSKINYPNAEEIPEHARNCFKRNQPEVGKKECTHRFPTTFVCDDCGNVCDNEKKLGNNNFTPPCSHKWVENVKEFGGYLCTRCSALSKDEPAKSPCSHGSWECTGNPRRDGLQCVCLCPRCNPGPPAEPIDLPDEANMIETSRENAVIPCLMKDCAHMDCWLVMIVRYLKTKEPR